ncbi:interferon alpha-inducible protein 27-like protein 2A [Sardina pilchardus]|uniref:interferon alpha-inducible protein 27-like protein 2A n=1 Tax=Sardina pilchardus TaxID=27697 RepID=UPI002E157216
MGLLTALAVVAGAGGAVVAAPLVIAGVGFTAGGIAAGSWAAAAMSVTATANGGAVAAGSMVAILQSIGVVGLSTGATAAVGATGGTLAGITAAVLI